MHKKSPKKLQQRKIRGIILRGSFNDKNAGEIVSRMTRAEVLKQLTGPVEFGLVPDVEKGEILTDSRGTGTFQRSG
jgi:hypothetical protein